jgi:L-lactate dehydrogenase complex protein LldE
VGIACYQLLQKMGCEVFYPLNQTCCGQPMANAGFNPSAQACSDNFIENFDKKIPIICPSGSCTLHVKEHLAGKEPAAHFIRNHIYELTEFIVDHLQYDFSNATFPFKVGYHTSCHGQRGLHLSSMSELVAPSFSKPVSLLRQINGIDLSFPKRVDECCGFGGTFCVTEEALSVKMGLDRLQSHLDNQVEIITANDMSCLMHLEGIIKRNHYPLQVMHIAEILNQSII